MQNDVCISFVCFDRSRGTKETNGEEETEQLSKLTKAFDLVDLTETLQGFGVADSGSERTGPGMRFKVAPRLSSTGKKSRRYSR